MAPRATFFTPERGRSLIARRVFVIACVWIFPWFAFDNANAQIPAYGNLQAQEYGDAVYRELGFWGSIGLDYNHTGVFAGIDSNHVPKTMEAKGEASIFPTGDDTTVEVNLSEFNGPDQTYYGAYTSSYTDFPFAARKSIVATAASIVAAYISVTTSLSTPPTVGYRRQGSNVVFSWPTNFSGFTLEFATGLPASSWTSNSASPAIVNWQFAVTNAIGGGQKFYRLKK